MRISDWSSDVCSSDLLGLGRNRILEIEDHHIARQAARLFDRTRVGGGEEQGAAARSDRIGHARASASISGGGQTPRIGAIAGGKGEDRKSTRLNSSH